MNETELNVISRRGKFTANVHFSYSKCYLTIVITYINRIKRNYSCNFCHILLSQKVNLMRRIRKHMEDKLYECQICLKSFPEKFDLMRHTKIHMGRTILNIKSVSNRSVKIIM